MVYDAEMLGAEAGCHRTRVLGRPLRRVMWGAAGGAGPLGGLLPLSREDECEAALGLAGG